MAWDPKKFKKPDAETLKKLLSGAQYDCTQKEGTEFAFNNAYWNFKEPGIYVDIVSGEPLFASVDKFDSGTGWPSFTKPLTEDSLKSKTDFKIGVPRTEVRSRYADSHLGHVFDDGPDDQGGQRFCINSAAIRFVPMAEMAEQGYEDWLVLFEGKKK